MNVGCVMFYSVVSNFRITRHSSVAALVRAAGSSADVQESLPWSYYQGLSGGFARLHGGAAGGQEILPWSYYQGLSGSISAT